MTEIRLEYLPRQKEALNFLSVHSEVTDVLYGGAKGGAKTVLGCRWQIERRLKYPGTKGIIGRSSLKELKQSTMTTLFEWFAKYQMIPGRHFSFNSQDMVITFYNKSKIHFIDLFDYPGDPDFTRLGGLEVMDAFADECGELSSKCVSILKTLCRKNLRDFCHHCAHHEPRHDFVEYWTCAKCGKETRGIPIKVLLTCNPTKNWLYHDFYMPDKNHVLPASKAFVKALPKDNPYLPQSYLDELDALPEYDRKRLRDGDWEYDDNSASLFKTQDLHRCFRDEIDMTTDIFITADIARFGRDRTVICVWRGLTVIDIHSMHRVDVQGVGKFIRELIQKHNCKLSNVIADEDGVGGGVVDFLKCRGFLNGSKAPHPDKFSNLKAECYYHLALLVEQGKIVFQAGDRNQVIRELEMIKRHKSESDQKLSVTPKAEISKQHGISPDISDAIMMRMFYEVTKTRGVYAIN